MKRIISILLILCISLSSTAIASAQSYKISNVVNSEIINAEEIVLHKDVEGSIILRGEDYANGNSCFFLIENGNVISSSYVDKTDATTTYTNYETMTTQTEKILRADKVSTIASMTTSGYTFAREVGFYLTKITQGESHEYGPSFLRTEYKKKVFYPEYNLHRKYKDAADLAGQLAAALLLVTGTALPLALEILSVLGIPSKAVDFVIGDKMVAATQIKVTWRAEGGSDNQKIEGSKYTFRLDGSELTTEYDGEYFAINSMKNENETLALKLAKKYFPGFQSYRVDWKVKKEKK